MIHQIWHQADRLIMRVDAVPENAVKCESHGPSGPEAADVPEVFVKGNDHFVKVRGDRMVITHPLGAPAAPPVTVPAGIYRITAS